MASAGTGLSPACVGRSWVQKGAPPEAPEALRGRPRFQRSRRLANRNSSATTTPDAVAASARTATEDESAEMTTKRTETTETH